MDNNTFASSATPAPTVTSQPESTPTSIQGETPPQSQSQKPKTGLIIGIIIAVLAIIIGIIVLIVVINNDSDDGKKEKSSSANSEDSNDENGSEKDSNKIAVKTNWKEMEFSINGAKKQLPLTEEELMEGLNDWKIFEQSGSNGYLVYSMAYYGPDKTIMKTHNLILNKNKATNKFFTISSMLMDSDENTTFEVNGINETSTEKDVYDLLGAPASNSIGEYAERKSDKGWTYYYYVNGKNTEDGYLSLSGEIGADGHTKSIMLVDTKDWPKTDK